MLFYLDIDRRAVGRDALAFVGRQVQPMNNLQLFRMYRRFRHTRNDATIRRGWDRKGSPNLGIAVDSDKYAREWQKWQTLSEMTREELEKRLTPPADDSLQRRNDAVRFCARLGLFTPDGKIEYRQ